MNLFLVPKYAKYNDLLQQVYFTSTPGRKYPSDDHNNRRRYGGAEDISIIPINITRPHRKPSQKSSKDLYCTLEDCPSKLDLPAKLTLSGLNLNKWNSKRKEKKKLEQIQNAVQYIEVIRKLEKEKGKLKKYVPPEIAPSLEAVVEEKRKKVKKKKREFDPDEFDLKLATLADKIKEQQKQELEEKKRRVKEEKKRLKEEMKRDLKELKRLRKEEKMQQRKEEKEAKILQKLLKEEEKRFEKQAKKESKLLKKEEKRIAKEKIKEEIRNAKEIKKEEKNKLSKPKTVQVKKLPDRSFSKRYTHFVQRLCCEMFCWLMVIAVAFVVLLVQI